MIRSKRTTTTTSTTTTAAATRHHVLMLARTAVVLMSTTSIWQQHEMTTTLSLWCSVSAATFVATPNHHSPTSTRNVRQLANNIFRSAPVNTDKEITVESKEMYKTEITTDTSADISNTKTNNNKVFDRSLPSFVWSMPHEDYLHPEREDAFPVGQWLEKKANVGIALSGGGMRAASCTLGWLRALHEEGLLHEARYISANSGATWVTVPLAAKELIHRLETDEPFPYDAYLGKIVPPEHIQGDPSELGKIGEILAQSNILVNGVDNVSMWDNVKKLAKPIIEFITNAEPSSAGMMTRSRAHPQADFTAWVDAIDDNFVKTMNISSSSRPLYYGIQKNYLVEPKQPRNDNNKRKHQHASEFPFPIYVATVYPAGDSKPGIAVPFEFTPFYSGIPMDPRLFNKKNMEMGGGYTQYHVFNSSIAEPGIPAVTFENENAPALVRLPAPTKMMNIAEVTGISSSFFGAAVLSMGWRQKLVSRFLRLIPQVPAHVKKFINPTKYNYWSPVSGGPSRPLEFVDGGLYDNTGVLALLRRNCSCIITCVACDSAASDSDPTKMAEKFGDLAALFGKAKSPESDIRLKRFMAFLFGKQPIRERVKNYFGGKPMTKSRLPIPSPNDFRVFNGDDWDDLASQLHVKWTKGVPQVVRMKLNVTENPKAGVYADRTVDLIVCINGRATKSWNDKLTNKGLKKKITPGLFSGDVNDAEGIQRWLFDLKKPTHLSPNFPYFSTFRVIYDDEAVNMMAHLSSFALKTGLDEVGFRASEFYD